MKARTTTKRKPVKKKLRTTARAARSVAEEAFFDEEPNMRLSRAFVVVLILHVVAVGGILVFNNIKATQEADRKAEAKPVFGNPQVVNTAAAPTEIAPGASNVSTAGRKVHRVRSGDNLTKISRLYGVNIQDLAELNGVLQTTSLQIGQRLYIPAKAVAPIPQVAARSQDVDISKVNSVVTSVPRVASTPKIPVTPAAPVSTPSTYVVVAGDNPHAIARRLNVNYQELLKLNGITDPRLLQIGAKLKVPSPKP